ncbi:hypothetical protein Tco_1549659 [Tanacetum coccineum]
MIQALVDGKKVIVTETSVRRDLQLKDAEGNECLPNATIFVELERIGDKTTAWNEFSSTMAFAIICLATNQKFNFSKYIFNNMVKNLEGGVKFLMYPRFVQVFLHKQVEGMTKHKEIYVTPSYTKKVFANMKREGKGFSGRVTPLFQTMMVQAPKELDETEDVESIPIHSNYPLLNGEDRLKLNELMELYTKLSQRVLDLENTKTSQAIEIGKLKEKVKKLERRREEMADLDAEQEITLVDEAQERNDDNLKFDTRVFYEQEVEVEKVVSTAEVTTASTTITIVDELTLAQTLIEIKAAKPKAVTTTATTTTTTVTRPKARGVAKDKGKAKMIEPKKPLKNKDQILVDEEIAQRLQEELQAELEEEERLARQKEEEDNLISWDNTQAMMEADYELAQRLQAEEQVGRFICSYRYKGCKSQTKGSKKRTREELESDNSKKQKIDENVEAEVDDEAEMKKLMEIVPDDEVAIDAIPLATKSPIIVDWKIIKEEKMGYFQIIRAYVSSRRYSSMIRMLQNINREDLETL